MPASASISRRDLLRGRTQPPPFRSLPPGAGLATLAACTGCGACVRACPETVLLLVGDKVALDPQLGECSFCGRCAEVCPEPVFADDRRMAHRFDIADHCLARAGITCMTCRDTCPEAAISMRPRIGGPFLPVIDQSSCTGCGACVAPCPSQAIAAIPREYEDEF
jgi:ferredoxin-type protein NapF